MKEFIHLTKSTFLRGLQCPKSLMLNELQPELRDPLDSQSQLRMRLGQEVGMLARGRYPGGEIGRIPGMIDPSLRRTQDLIKAGMQVLYEPAFQFDQVFILVDILVMGEQGWRLIEVKSTSQVKDQHLWDLAVQLFVLRGSGLLVEDAILLHMNSDYVRQGALDLQALFQESSLIMQVEELQPQVEASISSSISHLHAEVVPDRDIGPYCKDPVDCDFIGHCWAHLPQPSIFDLYRLTMRKKFELYQAGITRIEDVPASFAMPSSSGFHAEAHKARATVLKRDEVMAFIKGLRYPLFFLDFETFGIPIPPYDGLSPYTNVPFQYSLHMQEVAGAAARHTGFLAQAGIDPRLDFIKQLLAEIGTSGDVIVYNASFERNVLRGLAEQFPHYAEALQALIERLIDLMEPFRQRLYWVPEMGGSVSLKSVLPALVPALGYDDLDVQDGTQAMDTYLQLVDLGDGSAADAQREALRAYCERDTLAMVRILEALEKLL